MKKEYSSPEIDVIFFVTNQDICTTSDFGYEETDDDTYGSGTTTVNEVKYNLFKEDYEDDLFK